MHKQNTISEWSKLREKHLHLAEDRDKRFEHVALTIEANACGHEGS